MHHRSASSRSMHSTRADRHAFSYIDAPTNRYANGTSDTYTNPYAITNSDTVA